ncbi:hypothetical protein [Pseudomonas cerasi]|uniref:hypothetical protein n=1 Tax=Pseudomonas cerasi TaxID=1583341 RepID=UPI0012FFC1BF|nr:hypothetical protein [Pseudomonas cerasi]
MISDPFLEPESIGTDAPKKNTRNRYFYSFMVDFFCVCSILLSTNPSPAGHPMAQIQMELVFISTPLAPALSGLGIRKSA